MSVGTSKIHKKNKWTTEEDNLLREAVSKNGSRCWGVISRFVPGRTGKQCRERWIFGLDPSINKDTWTKEEDETLIQLQKEHGNKWSKFLEFLPGRSSSGCKNRWSLLNRRMLTSESHSTHMANDKSKTDEKEKVPIIQKTAHILAVSASDPFDFPPDSIFNDFSIFEENSQFLPPQKSEPWFD